MTELSKLSQQVEKLKSKLDGVASLGDQNIEDANHYGKIKAIYCNVQAYNEQIIHLLAPSIAKLVTKSESMDPVTGVFRYNPAARTKINNLNDEINSMKVICEDLFLSYSGCVQKYSTQFNPDEISSDTVSSEIFNIPPAAKHYQIDMQYLTASAVPASGAYTGNLDTEYVTALDSNNLEENRRLADDLRKAKQQQIQELTTRTTHVRIVFVIFALT